jgi:hypothetical protein
MLSPSRPNAGAGFAVVQRRAAVDTTGSAARDAIFQLPRFALSADSPKAASAPSTPVDAPTSPRMSTSPRAPALSAALSSSSASSFMLAPAPAPVSAPAPTIASAAMSASLQSKLALALDSNPRGTAAGSDVVPYNVRPHSEEGKSFELLETVLHSAESKRWPRSRGAHPKLDKALVRGRCVSSPCAAHSVDVAVLACACMLVECRR